MRSLGEIVGFDFDQSYLLLNRCEFASQVEFTVTGIRDDTVACLVENRTLHLRIPATCKLLEIAH